jgi:hypothetical protein
MWLSSFPDYRERGHIPAIRFWNAVRDHLVNSRGLASPTDADCETLRRELDHLFRGIRRSLRTSVDGGVLAAITGLVGIAADLLIFPGFSYALNSLSALLILGGGATTYSGKQEIRFLADAERLVGDWLHSL